MLNGSILLAIALLLASAHASNIYLACYTWIDADTSPYAVTGSVFVSQHGTGGTTLNIEVDTTIANAEIGNDTFIAHVHAAECSNSFGGPHWKIDDNVAETIATNELWTADQALASENAFASVGNSFGYLTPSARSVVIHQTNADGSPRRACCDLQVATLSCSSDDFLQYANYELNADVSLAVDGPLLATFNIFSAKLQTVVSSLNLTGTAMLNSCGAAASAWPLNDSLPATGDNVLSLSGESLISSSNSLQAQWDGALLRHDLVSFVVVDDDAGADAIACCDFFKPELATCEANLETCALDGQSCNEISPEGCCSCLCVDAKCVGDGGGGASNRTTTPEASTTAAETTSTASTTTDEPCEMNFENCLPEGWDCTAGFDHACCSCVCDRMLEKCTEAVAVPSPPTPPTPAITFGPNTMTTTTTPSPATTPKPVARASSLQVALAVLLCVVGAALLSLA